MSSLLVESFYFTLVLIRVLPYKKLFLHELIRAFYQLIRYITSMIKDTIKLITLDKILIFTIN